MKTSFSNFLSKNTICIFFRIVNLSSVISPIILIANPGPGNGCLNTKFSGIPNSNPVFLTSSLNKSLKGSTISLKST